MKNHAIIIIYFILLFWIGLTIFYSVFSILWALIVLILIPIIAAFIVIFFINKKSTKKL